MALHSATITTYFLNILCLSTLCSLYIFVITLFISLYSMCNLPYINTFGYLYLLGLLIVIIIINTMHKHIYSAMPSVYVNIKHQERWKGIICVTLSMAWVLVPDRLVSAFQKLLIAWDFYTHIEWGKNYWGCESSVKHLFNKRGWRKMTGWASSCQEGYSNS